MIFEKDTIMGQVLSEVNDDIFNKQIITEIERVMLSINDSEYIDYEGPVWNKNGLMITDMDLNGMDLATEDKRWSFVETAYTTEYSWLVFELAEIYQPSPQAAHRLYSTIGYLFEVYDEKYDDLDMVLRMVTLVSTVWLHPDHIGQDRFMVHPISLPNFGSEF